MNVYTHISNCVVVIVFLRRGRGISPLYQIRVLYRSLLQSPKYLVHTVNIYILHIISPCFDTSRIPTVTIYGGTY